MNNITHEFINDGKTMVIYIDGNEVFALHIGEGQLVAIANELSKAPQVIQKYILDYLGLHSLVVIKKEDN
jgi:hypothetical protein